MKISKLQKYKNVGKILTGMLAVTLSVGMITDFSWKEVVSSVRDFGINVVAFAEGEQGGGDGFDFPVKEIDNIVKWKYKDTDENCIYVKIVHTKDISKIEDQSKKERVTFEEGVREVVARYELKEGDTKFRIVDIEGDYQWVDIGEIELNISRAYKNENGDVIAISMETKEKNIKKVTYLDDSNEPDEIEVVNAVLGEEGKTSHPMAHYDVDKGTTGVLVYLEDEEEVPYEVQLALDWKAPEVDRVYKNGDNTKMMIKAMDNESGIDKIYIDGKLMTIIGTSREVVKIIESGVKQVKLCDAVGHETVVTAKEDSTFPQIEKAKVYKADGSLDEDKYILKVIDDESGLWKVVADKLGGDEDIIIRDYSKKDENNGVLYPKTKQELELDLNLTQWTGIKKIYAYDALGNKAEINLDVNCVIVYTHKNLEGSKIAISLYDEEEREIDKIGILNNAKELKIIEKLPVGTTRLIRCYETPEGTKSIRVFYKTDDLDENLPEDHVLDTYEEAPTVVGNRAVSLVGINRVEYSDGRKVEFNDSMPTTVKLQLAQGGSAKVYDSLDNCSIVK